MGCARASEFTGCRVLLEFHRLFLLCATDEVGVEREQFEFARASLAQAGFRLRHSDDAWCSFTQMRSTYSASLNALARYFAMPVERQVLSHMGTRTDFRKDRASQKF